MMGFSTTNKHGQGIEPMGVPGHLAGLGVTFLCGLICVVAGDLVRAQPGLLPENFEIEPATETEVFSSELALPTERTASRGITMAEQRIGEGRYAEAIHFLDGVLARDEDAFLENSATAQPYHGLKSTARRILGSLPSAGRNAYLLAYEARARNALAAAIESGDLAAIQTLSRRYFHTPAGYQATLLLARNELDQGRPASAAAMYEQMLESPHATGYLGPQLYLLTAVAHLQAGHADAARRALERLAGEYPNRQVTLGGVAIDLFQPAEDPVDWLTSHLDWQRVPSESLPQDWTLYRGDPARNRESSGGPPHMTERWRVPTANNHRVEKMLRDLRDAYQNHGIALLPSVYPLAVGDMLIMRSTHQMIGVDFRTGKRIWNAVPETGDSEYEEFVESLDRVHGETVFPSQVQAMAQRMWDDALYGSLSSDGRFVYGVRELPIGSESVEQPLGLGAIRLPGRLPGLPNPSEWTGPTNRLTALDLRAEGKQVWEIDGATADGPLAGAFFLGPPLPIDGRLYVLAEIQSSIQLVVIRPTDTWPRWELEWIQQLAHLESAIIDSPRRRLAGAVPSAQDGVLVCPTAAGAVIGVDRIQRTLLWAYRYPVRVPNLQGVHPQIARIQRQQMEQMRSLRNSRWIDGTAILVDGRVLLTPPDSDFLHCIDLRTGARIWQRPRENALWIAGVEGQHILLIGQQSASAVRLDTGDPAWEGRTVAYPEGALPTGRGFLSEGQYYVPVSTGEMIVLDVVRGRLADRVRSRTRSVLGNLVCHQGAILAQSESCLKRYDQLTVVRQQIDDALARNPDDPRAHRELGEIAYNANDLPSAIQHLHRALTIDANDPVTKDRLIDCLLTTMERAGGLDQEHLALLERLVTTDSEPWWRMERLVAENLDTAGDLVGAARIYIRLAAEDRRSVPDPLELADLRTSRSRWIDGQMTDLWRRADSEQRRAIEQLLRPMEEGLAADPTIARLKRHLSYFDGLPASARWRLVLAEKLLELGLPLESQLLLHDLLAAADGSIQAQAAATLAELYHGQGRHRAASGYDRFLADRYPETMISRSGTDRKISGLEFARDHAERYASSARGLEWGVGTVTHQVTSQRVTQVQNRLQHIRIEGPPDPSLAGRQLLIDPTRQQNVRGSIVVQDPWGNTEYSVPIETPEAGQTIRDMRGTRCHAVYRGGLCIVSVGDSILAIDMLTHRADASQRLLWHDSEVTDPRLAMLREPSLAHPGIGTFGSDHRTYSVDKDGSPIGVLGPITRHGVAYQVADRLQCVDLFSGTTIWSRKDIPPGCLLHGDADYLLVQPPKSDEAILIRMVDGKRLGVRPVPAVEDQLASFERSLILWRPASRRAEGGLGGGQVEMELARFDPVSGEARWSHAFPAGSKVWLAENRSAGVVDPAGRFQLIDLEDGGVRIDRSIEREPHLDAIYLVVAATRIFLVTSSATGGVGEKVGYDSILDSEYPIVSGRIYAFDRRTGGPAWPCPAEVRHHGLVLWQPRDLPILPFIRRVPASGRGSNHSSSILCLDRTSGRSIFRRDDLGRNLDSFMISVEDPNRREVTMTLLTQQVKLTWTTDPRSPEPPFVEDIEVGRPRGRSSGLLQMIFGS